MINPGRPGVRREEGRQDERRDCGAEDDARIGVKRGRQGPRAERKLGGEAPEDARELLHGPCRPNARAAGGLLELNDGRRADDEQGPSRVPVAGLQLV